jgi:hypothetical protein
LEYSLRATSAATDKAKFGTTSAQRAATMKQRLLEVQSLLQEPLLAPALEAVSTVELRLGNALAILASADALGQSAYTFAERADGEKLSAIDKLLPSPSQYKTGR